MMMICAIMSLLFKTSSTNSSWLLEALPFEPGSSGFSLPSAYKGMGHVGYHYQTSLTLSTALPS